MGCSRRAAVQEPTKDVVRVAAIQCYSAMGATSENLRNMTALARSAAKQGANIIVFPECAVQGYMEPVTMTSWSKSMDSDTAVHRFAEKIPGPSTKVLSDLAQELKTYICSGIVEIGTNGFFNSQVLLNSEGEIIGHHRKKCLWTPGDSMWCERGDLPIQVVDTEFGRLGLMICYDFHSLPPLLAKQNVDIVLYSVGWYGPNEKNWFSNIFPRKAVVPYGFNIVVANWTGAVEGETWPGRGHSCVIAGNGEVLAMSESVTGNRIVISELKIRDRAEPSAAPLPSEGAPSDGR